MILTSQNFVRPQADRDRRTWREPLLLRLPFRANGLDQQVAGFVGTAVAVQIRHWPGVTARQQLDRYRFDGAGERNIDDFAASEMVRSFDQASRRAERDVFGAKDHLDPILDHL